MFYLHGLKTNCIYRNACKHGWTQDIPKFSSDIHACLKLFNITIVYLAMSHNIFVQMTEQFYLSVSRFIWGEVELTYFWCESRPSTCPHLPTHGGSTPVRALLHFLCSPCVLVCWANLSFLWRPREMSTFLLCLRSRVDHCAVIFAHRSGFSALRSRLI